MALIVETGVGVAGAESYLSVADATAYFAKRNKADAWDAVEDKEAALRLATDYIESTYRGMWKGMRSTTQQELDWPRQDVEWTDSPNGYYGAYEIPRALKNACAELAIRTANGDLKADLGRETLSETVDVISVTYAQGAARQTQYEAVDDMLSSLLRGGGGTIPVVRA